MTTFNRLYLFPGGWIVSLFLLLSSCLVDDREYIRDDEEIQAEGETEILLPLRLPNSLQATTKDVGTDKENQVEDLYVLVFDSQKDEYLYNYMTTQVETPDTNRPDEKTAKLKLLYGVCEDNIYDLVFLANASEVIGSIRGGIPQYLSKKSVMDTLVYEQKTRLGTPIMMWGEERNVKLVPGENKELDAVSLVRMVAKVNVSVDENENTFTLTSIHVYNAMDRGYIAPLNGWDPDSYEKPNVPSTAIPLLPPYAPVISYSQADITDNSCMNAIYLFEAKKGEGTVDKDPEKMLNNTCLVIGGVYKGNTYYYRLDFMEEDTITGLSGYIPLLRNHGYNIAITQVSGPGYNDPDEAFNSAPMNMKAKIVSWNEASMKNIYFDGQYYLSLNEKYFYLSREEQAVSNDEDSENVLKIETNYPHGWQIDSIICWDSGEVKYQADQNTGWLDATDWKGGSGESSLFLLLKHNSTLSERTAALFLSAGRIRCELVVTQSNISVLALSITDPAGNPISELLFPARGTISAQEFQVSWQPGGTPVSVTSILPGTYASAEFDFDTSLDVIRVNDQYSSTTTGNKGAIRLKVRPTPIDPDQTSPFYERSSRIEFAATNGMSTLYRSITLRQMNYGIEIIQSSEHVRLGDVVYFDVKCNSTWEITSITGEKEVVLAPGEEGRLVGMTGGYNMISGDRVEFTISNNEDAIGKSITFHLMSTEGLFGEATVTFSVMSIYYPNSYIVSPDSKEFSFPIRKVYQAWEESTYFTRTSIPRQNLTAVLLWQDEPGMITNVRLENWELGENARVKFDLPNKALEGNAVIAVRAGTVTYWVYHIWVTDYNPALENDELPHGISTSKPYIFMNRNLGATVNQRGHLRGLGLSYQWGRSVPYPGSAVVNTSDVGLTESGVRTLYNVNGTQVRAVVDEGTLSGSHTDIGIRNPLRFYQSDNWMKGISPYYYDFVWNDEEGRKGILDPCPDGWRVPVLIPMGGTVFSPWNLFTASSIDFAQYGFVHRDTDIYYPANGAVGQTTRIDGDREELRVINAGMDARYWLANSHTSQPISYDLFMNYRLSNGLGVENLSQTTTRRTGFGIRCVKDVNY